MLSRMAFDVLTFCVLVNAGPWVQMERRDKRCAEGRRAVVMTGICGGQFRKSPSVWHATVICLENSPPAGKQFPDDYLLTMEHLWTQARDTVGVEFFTEITSVNEKDFNPVAFVAGLNLRDQLQHPQLPTWREQHELWIKKQRRQLRKQYKWPQKSKHAFEGTERSIDRWNNIDIEKIDS
ncbi:uncharacterized protein LOC120424626 [Culex pipiens pallens]|uniref:uncharacterized protein LOC120424626 n=1 Tax=Culex pipiens pallens TaxID=42434 RepID=UPI0019532AAE|nr:uncharacterized protein LOC120424626 [Culex pipiens pallens]